VNELAGRYELRERLGSGAMADVHRARDRTTGHHVAIKLMRPGLADDAELLRRFERESSTLRSLHHPNIVEVLDHGTRDGAPYLVMELVEGPTLQELLRERGRLSEDDARHIGAQVASALDAAHAQGTIHRDLKPGNILITADGTAKVTDFGIAHLDAMTQLTRTGEVLGTPRYIAPEQVTGRADARSDLYALGIVLYELVVGHPPFDGENPVAIVQQQLTKRPAPPRQLAPGLSREMDALILRALEKDPGRRFASAAALRDALRPRASAPVAAMAMRQRGSGRARGIAAIPLALVFVLLFAGAALGRLGTLNAAVADAPDPAPIPVASPATVAPTHAPAHTQTVAPATPRPTPDPTPTPTADPTPSSTPVAGAVAATPAVATPRAQPTSADPRAAVSLFYQMVSAHRYDEAAALWSPRMRATYPPSTNINGRFDATRSISVRSSQILSQNATSATVAVELVEVLTNGSARVWVGQWQLVRSGSAWLMDAPSLARG
jgi:serine/threonine-protein kinase